jgi:hypothetical protein
VLNSECCTSQRIERIADETDLVELIEKIPFALVILVVPVVLVSSPSPSSSPSSPVLNSECCTSQRIERIADETDLVELIEKIPSRLNL